MNDIFVFGLKIDLICIIKTCRRRGIETQAVFRRKKHEVSF
jgi:hypothetical protein